MKTISKAIAALAAVTTAVCSTAAPADPFADVEIKAQHVAGSVYMLEGAGGNIGVSVGPDGTLVIDDQFAPLAPRIMAAIEAIDGDHPRVVINTHYHGDHTGSNAFFGEKAVIVAHDNVRVRLLNEDLPRSALPIVTFDDRVRMHFNDDEIDIVHLPRGHTDGDSIVWFKSANVVHMGDHFFAGAFPYVDVDAGGTVDGLVANIERVISQIPADARIIPGHGALGTVVDLGLAVDTIRMTQERVRQAVADGTINELVETGFGAELESWGAGFIDAERWIGIVQASDDSAGDNTSRPRR